MEFEISLKDLRFFARHGVMPFEREMGNEFKVDLLIKLPCDDRFEDDSLDNTVSYADLFEIVADEMNTPRKLLETVALNIAKKIRNYYPQVMKGKITIEKMRPPIVGMIGKAAVSLEF